MSPHVRNIALDLVLSLITCYLWNLVVQHAQIMAVNEILKRPKYNFGLWLVLTIITCGLYHIYHEYRLTSDLCIAQGNPHGSEPLMTILLSIFGLSLVVDAIQQSQINKLYGHSGL